MEILKYARLMSFEKDSFEFMIQFDNDRYDSISFRKGTDAVRIAYLLRAMADNILLSQKGE